MISANMLLSYPYWKIPFTVHIDDSDKQVGAVIAFFSIILSKTQRNYNTTEKELLVIV